MFFNYNWCRGFCCNRRENLCNKPCHKKHEDYEKDCNCREEKKHCHIKPFNDDDCNKDFYYQGRSFEDLNTSYYSNDQDCNSFRYYDQYGSFNQSNSCDCKPNKNDCKQDTKMCKPTKFICFPVDKY